MKKGMLFLVPILMVLFSVNNVKAYTNGNLYSNLIMPSQAQFYGWDSSGPSTLGTAYQLDSTNVHTDYQQEYYYLTSSPYNDSNGMSFSFPLPINIKPNDVVNITTVFCTLNSVNWYGTYKWYSIDNATDINSHFQGNATYNNESIGSYETDATSFANCRAFKLNFTAQNSGQWFSIKFMTSNQVQLQQVSFMGYQLEKNGIDYSAYFNELGSDISDLESSILENGGKLDDITGAIGDTNEKLDDVTGAIGDTNEKLDDMINADADASVNPDDSKYNDYESAEGDLKDKVRQADLTNLSIGIDSKSSSWIWDNLTNFINANSIVFSMYIAILSIGVIKLALGR